MGSRSVTLGGYESLLRRPTVVWCNVAYRIIQAVQELLPLASIDYHRGQEKAEKRKERNLDSSALADLNQ